jgi:hypothetical protein
VFLGQLPLIRPNYLANIPIPLLIPDSGQPAASDFPRIGGWFRDNTRTQILLYPLNRCFDSAQTSGGGLRIMGYLYSSAPASWIKMLAYCHSQSAPSFLMLRFTQVCA